MELEYEGFYAVCDHMHGQDRTLRVGGTVVAPATGWAAELEEYTGQPSPVQFVLKLRLKVTAPQDGAEETITPIPLDEYELKNPPFEYDQVEFAFEGPDGIEGPRAIKVEHPE